MKKILSLLSLLLALSLTALNPAYAGSHEKKAEDAVASTEEKTEASEETKSKDEIKDDKTGTKDSDKKKKETEDDDEEPECD